MARTRGLGAKRTLAVLAVTAAAVAAAPAAEAAECDPVMPKHQLTAGMTGTGWTVVRGRTREAFSVEILGVLANLVAPGRDMILIEVSSPAVGRAGGTWAGMSGSPVYIDGKLVGALAYGMGGASGNTAIAGVTPAEEMLGVLGYPLAAAGTAAAPAPAPRVVLPRALAQEAAGRLGVSVAKTSSLTQLRVPFTVSGASAAGLRRVQRYADARALPLLPIAGSSASRVAPSASAAAAPEPGDNAVALASYGDVTLAGVGTVTYVCAGRALVFGHPLGLFGPTTMGLSAGDSLGVVPNPGYVPFKLATAAEPLGTIDQDRLAGLRGLLGVEPPRIPLRSTVSVPAEGTRLDGATDVVLEEMAGFATFLHVGMSIESAFDGMRPGTAAVAWTIEGTRAGGAPWRLARSNLYAGRGEIGFRSAMEVASQLEALLSNPFEDVRVTGANVSATVRPGEDALTIDRVLVAKGRGAFRKRQVVRALPGERIRVRVVLAPAARGQSTRRADFAFRMPRNAPPLGLVEISGASFSMDEECMMEDGPCGGDAQPKSFGALLRSLQTAPRNDVLTAKLRLGPKLRVKVTRQKSFDAVVEGGAQVMIGPPRGAGPEGP